jgi:hypothetical protein
MPTLQGPPKFIQIGIFGLKSYHLATLVDIHIADSQSVDKMTEDVELARPLLTPPGVKVLPAWVWLV